MSKQPLTLQELIAEIERRGQFYEEKSNQDCLSVWFASGKACTQEILKWIKERQA